MIFSVLQVALGGAVGSVLRYLTSLLVGAPLATLVVNVVGSFAMGLLFILLASRTQLPPLLMTGLLGGFTTFSAFSLDALRLWQAGQAGQAALYVVGTVTLSLAGVVLGVMFGRGLVA
ncbi:MAG: fluoride efflux transporter CrcB [Paracoccaceae bacterium]